MSPSPLTAYKNALERELKGSTEHTFRPALKTLLEALAPGTTATNEPKRIKCGAPDFVVTRKQTPLGYVEAKDIGKSLDEEEKSEQLTRYLESLGNLILTDYLEFRWYVQGEHRLTARLAKEGTGDKLRIEKEGAEKVGELLNAFFKAKVPTVGTPKELAARMAALARLIRNAIRNALEDEDKGGTLHEQMEGFRKVLLHDLTEDQFADMYAQTICYGLFAARCNMQGPGPFTREHAAYDLPKTNPFLRRMFGYIAGPNLDDRVVWAVEDLVELLKRADIRTIQDDFGKRTRQEDPVVHFYETFLAAYDPKLRETRGVYYTPEPVVSYIVRSIDHILKKDFGLKDGLADASKIKMKGPDGKKTAEVHKVQILDPATGTGTFLYSVIDLIHQSFAGKEGMWSAYVSEHLLPRLFGFELLMAPYAVAHMKLGIQLAESRYDFKSDERLGIYLTNTLEEAIDLGGLVVFAQWLAEEANAAGKVKQEAPVMVVLGNPPYSGHSVNKGQWIANLLRGLDTRLGTSTGNYFAVDGKPLGERNPKWLNDDYVKFIRFAQWRIELTGYGILAFISNNGYIDNPTFRGMRQSLMKTFDDIYILDLHGSSKKKEHVPDGSKDENVFDIQQGVSVGIFVKRSDGKKTSTVRHAALWGLREKFKEGSDGERVLCGGKYYWLWENSVETTKWEKLNPSSPHYLFIPQDTRVLPEYEEGWKLTEIMPVNVLGFQTHRDHFAIDFDRSSLRDRISKLREKMLSDDDLKNFYGLKDNRDWKLREAREQLRRTKEWESRLIKCLYRPFDWRYCYFSTIAMDYPRRELLDHVAGQENLCLLIPRQIGTIGWRHVGIAKDVAESCLVSTRTKEQNYNFPLYLYPAPEEEKHYRSNLLREADRRIRNSGLYSGDEAEKESQRVRELINRLFPEELARWPNLASEFIGDFVAKLKLNFLPTGKGDGKKTFGPEDVLSYTYAIFHSPAYRRRYSEFLKSDFPRLPLTSNKTLFRSLCVLGGELMALHLMEKHGPEITRFRVSGSNKVERIRHTVPGQGAEKGRAWINKTQYFEGVPPEVWEFHVGGYQVCEKWLKDRKGRKLIFDDLTHYQRIVSALAETIRLMAEIDKTIEAHGGWPIK